jgi:hypothetical protein
MENIWFYPSASFYLLQVAIGVLCMKAQEEEVCAAWFLCDP